MICRKCGKELEEKAKFCVYCGAGLESPPPGLQRAERETPPGSADRAGRAAQRTDGKRVNLKKLFAAITVAAVLIAGGAVALGVYFSPVAEMNRAIDAGDFEKALSVKCDRLSDKELTDKTVGKLADAAESVAEDYAAGAIHYDEACSRLDQIEQFWCEGVDDALDDAWQAVNAKWELENMLDNAEAALNSREYTSAISYYEKALGLDSGSAAAQEGLQRAKDGLRQSALDEAQKYQAKGDFDAAEGVLKAVLADPLSGDPDLQAALESLNDAEAGYTIQEAYAATEAGEWDEALEMLEAYQQEKGTSRELTEAYADIDRKRPITLCNLTMVSSKYVKIRDEVVKDRWGNIYAGTVRYDASYDAYGYYSLEKNFERFSGTLFTSTEASNGKDMSVAIYKDDELVYFQDGITENTPPISFEIDVTNAVTLKIVSDNKGTYSCGYIEFGNTGFEKAEQAD